MSETHAEQHPIEELGFEEAMESLDSIVTSLEDGQLPLEDMVAAYERGMVLLRVCRSRIDAARRRVEAINLNLEGKEQATLSAFASLDTPDQATAGSSSPASASTPARRPSKKDSPSAPSGEKEDSGDEIRLF